MLREKGLISQSRPWLEHFKYESTCLYLLCVIMPLCLKFLIWDQLNFKQAEMTASRWTSSENLIHVWINIYASRAIRKGVPQHKSPAKIDIPMRLLNDENAFTLCSMNSQGPFDASCGQQRPWSDCASQSDQGLCCPHMLKDIFSHGVVCV